VLKEAHNPYILACHPQIDADPVPDSSYHFNADPDADGSGFVFVFVFDADPGYDPCGSGSDADLDPQLWKSLTNFDITTYKCFGSECFLDLQKPDSSL
jgi:hypothetical protein